jgi:hypothetical protein
VEAGVGAPACGACGGGGAVGMLCTGVAHCGQIVASSGMEAPHLKQNIRYPHSAWTWCLQSENYFIQIEKAIISRIEEPLS